MSGVPGVGSGGEMDLADAITLLRDQVAEAQSRISRPSGGGDKGVRFALGEIKVELGLELARSQGVNGGLRWSVIGLGGKKESGSKATHTVSVTLTPSLPGGGNVEVGGEE
ncbi:trypco2 family protein [Streptomyces venezuelae]|uniref:trypco2 family protein n=1 Tax=Streptomyces venezuelae TaxID=54571 RepID=UPI00278C20FC|nr:trypco2 family protein [Streptomyces venezuelae]